LAAGAIVKIDRIFLFGGELLLLNGDEVLLGLVDSVGDFFGGGLFGVFRLFEGFFGLLEEEGLLEEVFVVFEDEALFIDL
jgi:hypothetical protein